jgi:hypothetical protein
LAYSVGDTCPSCGIGTLVAAEPSSGAQFECNNCHTTHANAYGTAKASVRLSKIRAASGKKVRGKPKKEIEHQNKYESQVRYVVWRDDTGTKVIQVAYTPDGRIKHLDCKTCGNNWYLADNPDYSANFQLTNSLLECKKCRVVTHLASTENLSDKVTALIAANSLIALFLFAVSVQNVDLATPFLSHQAQASSTSLFTTLFIGLFTYAAIITAFRSIYSLLSDENYTLGYNLFRVVLVATVILILLIAFSQFRKVSLHTDLPFQLNLGPWEYYIDLALLLIFFAYVFIVVLKPRWIADFRRFASFYTTISAIIRRGSLLCTICRSRSGGWWI